MILLKLYVSYIIPYTHLPTYSTTMNEGIADFCVLPFVAAHTPQNARQEPYAHTYPFLSSVI